MRNHPAVFQDTKPVCFIDNMAVLSALVVGNSRVLDLSLPVYTVAMRSTMLNCSPWREHVDSAANIADGGSREGIIDPVAAKLGIRLHHVQWPSVNGKYLSVRDIQQEIIGEWYS